MKIDDSKFLENENLNENSKLPIFYFDYTNEEYPSKVDDLNFSKLKQMTTKNMKFQKYILIFGDKDGGDDKIKKIFGNQEKDFYKKTNADFWGNNFDGSGYLITNKELIMEILINNVYHFFAWKPLIPLNKDFDALDDYQEITKKFSEENK